MKQDWLYFESGVLPGATWLAGCTILGIMAQYISDALQSSDTIFLTLKRAGILLANQTQLNEHTEARDHEPDATPPDRDTGET